MDTENRPYLTFAAILIIGAIAGFFIKSALKAKITSSPDDRKITAVHQTFDFKAAQEKMDKEAQDLQNQQQDQGQAQPGQVQAQPGQVQEIPAAPGQ